MADGSNLKAKIGMDTGDFEKGAKKVTKAAQDMGKEIGSSLGDVGRNLGIDTGLLGELSKNISNATTLFKGMASAGGTAASTLTRAMTTLGGAIAGLGLTAAIAGFRELNNQANLFRNTVQGANLELESKAFKDTFRQAMEDQLGNGATWAGLIRNVSEKGTVAGGTFVSAFLAATPRIGGNAAQDFVNAITGVKKVIEASKVSKEQGEASRNFQQEINKILDERTEKLVSWQRLQREINEAEREAVDYTATKADREAAHADAVSKVNTFYDEQIAYARQLADAMTKQGALTENTKEENKAIATALAEVDRLEGERASKLKSLDKMYQRIEKSAGGTATSAKETAEAELITLEAATKLIQIQRQQKAIADQNAETMRIARNALDQDMWTLPGAASIAGLPSNAQIGAKYVVTLMPKLDTGAAEAAMIDLKGIVEDGVIAMSDAIGVLIGNLINGENAWGNFAQAAVGVVADMVSTLGQSFIKTGVGIEATNLAIRTGNGYAAIAAGAAMVAIAAAMKQSLSNAAATWGGGGYSTSVASSAYTSGSGNNLSTFGREMEVKVTGTLVADGSKLKAVLASEDYRTNVTT